MQITKKQAVLSKTFGYFLRLIEQGRVPAVLYKAIWKTSYQVISRRWRTDEWTFMNYGWLPEAGADELALAPEDEKNRYFIGLYHQLASRLDLKDKRVLEVGSGRGGGASWIARHYAPARLVALDYSPEAIKLSRQWHAGVGNLEFREGDAEQLPFPDGTFDVVINVESSHCYGNMEAFIAEVVRVLRPGGTFAWVDMRSLRMIERTERAFANEHLRPLEVDTLNAGVLRALDAADDLKKDIMKDLGVGSGLFRQFSGAKGSALYNAIAKGEVQYMLKILEKSPRGAGGAANQP